MSARHRTMLPAGLTADDLPAWMRRTRREVDWAFLVMAVLVIAAAWPFFARPGLPYNLGTRIEISRTVEMSEAIKEGILYPRWASDFNYGYGSPLWNYLPPLPHYLSALHHVLVQSNPETSVKAVFVLSLALNGLGMFSFARRRWGTHAALVASIVYLFSPPLVRALPYLESGLGLLLAVGIFWLALWSLDRLMSEPHGWNWLLASSMIACLWLSSAPINGLLFVAAAGWVIWRAAGERLPRRRWGAGIAALTLGTVLSGFYWIPAVGEASVVRWHSVADPSSAPWQTLRPAALLALPERTDLSAINPPAGSSLGVAVWGTALIGTTALIVWNWRRTPTDSRSLPRGEALQARLVRALRDIPAWQWESGYFGLLGLILAAVVMPPAQPLWDAIPDRFALYPRHLLPLIAGCGAMAAGQTGSLLRHLQSGLRRDLLLIVLLGAVLTLALPSLPLAPWPQSHGSPALADIVRDETLGHIVGSQASSLLLPAQVTTPPVLSPTLVSSYQAGLIDKVARDHLPTAVRVDAVDHGHQSERLLVKSAQPVEVVLLTFYLPGWRARAGDQRLRVRAEPGTGLILVDVPAGQQEVTIWLGTTPAQVAGWLVSVLALALAVGISVRQPNRQPEQRAYELRWKLPADVAPISQGALLAIVLIFGAGGTAARLAPERLAIRSERGIVRPAHYRAPRALQGGVDLLAFDLEPGPRLRAGDAFEVTLYWRATRPDLPDYQADLYLAAATQTGPAIRLARHRHPGALPSSRWPIWPLFESYVRDSYFLRLDKSLAPGEYNIVIQLGRCTQASPSPCTSIEPLFVQDGRGSRLGQHIVLPVTVEVVP